MHEWQEKLEDLSFQYVNPEARNSILERLDYWDGRDQNVYRKSFSGDEQGLQKFYESLKNDLKYIAENKITDLTNYRGIQTSNTNIPSNTMYSVGVKQGCKISLDKGGDVQYLNNGGTSNATNGALNSAAFDQSVKDFSTAVKDLSKVSLGGTLSVDGTINVNVNLNGGEVISAAKDTLGKMAAQKVQAGINDMLKAHFPNIPRKSDMVFGEGYDPSWAQQP